MEQKKGVNRRDFLKGAGVLAVSIVGMYFGLIPKDVRDAAFSRPIAKESDLKMVDIETAWNKIYSLTLSNSMSVGMIDETFPHRPRIEKAMMEVQTNGELPIMLTFQSRAKLFFSQNRESYIQKAKEETENNSISTNKAFEHFYLNEYLPKLIGMASSHGISLDALVMWLQVAEDVTGTWEGVKLQNKDVRGSRMQILFSYLEMLGMSKRSTLSTNMISRVDFRHKLESSIYDAPRLPKVTIGWSDLEPSLLSRGYIYLNKETRVNLEKNYPTVVKAIEKEVKSRLTLQSLRSQLKDACNEYAKEENILLDKLLQNNDNQGWVDLGFDRYGFHGIAGYLWQMANFTEVWAQVVEKIATKNLESQGTKKLSDRDIYDLINQAFKEVKEGKIKKYTKNKNKAKLDFIKDQIGNPLFLELLRKNESNQKALEILQLWDEFTLQTKNYQVKERELIKELGNREYDFDLQLALNIGVMMERMDRIKKSDPILSEKVNDPKKLGFSEWQAFLLLINREIASLPILIDESDECWGRFSLTDEPYDPYKTLLFLSQFVEKVDHYFAPIDPLSKLWRTIDVVHYSRHRALRYGTKIRIRPERTVIDQSKMALKDERFNEISRILGITIPVNGSLMRAIEVIDRLYRGDRYISTTTNLLPKP